VRRYLYGSWLLVAAMVLAAFMGSDGPVWP